MLKAEYIYIYIYNINLHKHNPYLLEQHSDSFKMLSATITINTEGESLIMKSRPGLVTYTYNHTVTWFIYCIMQL